VEPFRSHVKPLAASPSLTAACSEPSAAWTLETPARAVPSPADAPAAWVHGQRCSASAPWGAVQDVSIPDVHDESLPQQDSFSRKEEQKIPTKKTVSDPWAHATKSLKICYVHFSGEQNNSWFLYCSTHRLSPPPLAYCGPCRVPRGTYGEAAGVAYCCFPSILAKGWYRCCSPHQTAIATAKSKSSC
jgi:hypothetical protein